MLGLGLGLGLLWNASQNDAILHADAGKDSRECVLLPSSNLSL